MAEQNEEPVENLDLGKAKTAKPSKLMLYVSIALAIVAIGLGGALFYVIKHKPAETEEVEAKVEHKVPIYVDMEKELLINLPPATGSKFLQVGLSIMVFDQAVADVLKKHMPMLRNNLGLVLGTMDAARLRSAEGKQELQARILEEVNSLIQQQLPDASAEQVFFTTFVFQ